MCSPIAIHESAHAVAGICLGRRGLLKKVSIKATSEMKGGCHWNVIRGPCPPDEQNQELAIGFAGPIGQTLLAPNSLGSHAEAFASTILQPDEVLDAAGCAGWASTDLNFVIRIRRTGYPMDGFMKIERLVRSLLLRPSVANAIKALAARLDAHPEIDGPEAERLIAVQLAADDYVGNDYVK